MPQPFIDSVFVTGMPRSGTTLLDKLLSQHSKVQIFSQPLPLLFVEVKRAFLTQHALDSGGQEPPLCDLFGARSTERLPFQQYLATYTLSKDTMPGVLSEQEAYSGCYTKVPAALPEAGWETSLYEAWYKYCSILATTIQPGVTLKVIGSKETFCEEYIPYFLSRGSKVILIIRDPRDAICSALNGAGGRYAGHPRPMLFSIRQWRKSVEFAQAFRNHAGFYLVRYEDLVSNPNEYSRRLLQFMGLQAFQMDLRHEPLVDLTGEPWASNSSHAASLSVSTKSIGTHRRLLSPEATQLIEATCMAEMKLSGYRPKITHTQVEQVLQNTDLREPSIEKARPNLRGYVWTPEQAEVETQRWRHMRNSSSFEPNWFLYQQNYKALREAAFG